MSEIVFKPGQLVRLRYQWDDLDDDGTETTGKRTNCPDYYALKQGYNEDGCDEDEYKPIKPGQVGVFLEYADIKGGKVYRVLLCLVLFGEEKMKLYTKTLEPYS